MNDEINDIILEDLEKPENTINVNNEVLDNNILLNQEFSEFKDPTFSKPVNIKKKSDTMKLLSGFAAVIVLGVGAVNVTSSPNERVEFAFDDFIIRDTSIDYGFAISDYDTTDYTIKLQNSFTNRQRKVDDVYVTGSFENLAPNMKYTIKVVTPGSFGSERIIHEQSISTLSTSEYRTARFIDIETECRCEIDGFFYFKMNYIDHLNVFNDFYAYLEDDYGGQSSCYWNEDLHSEQKIQVTDSGLIGKDATLYVYCFSTLIEDTRIECYKVKVKL